jgi:hypothetical protein
MSCHGRMIHLCANRPPSGRYVLHAVDDLHAGAGLRRRNTMKIGRQATDLHGSDTESRVGNDIMSQ